MGWHADNEPELGQEPVIVSLSFGEKRRFQLKRKTAEDDLPEYQLTLFPGSLMIMYGRLQDDGVSMGQPGTVHRIRNVDVEDECETFVHQTR